MLILDLPPEVLENILNYLSYDEVSHCRLVCQRFNEISKKVLNLGYLNVNKLNMRCLKSVKSQLPRRASERYNHSLGGHYLIFTEIQSRLSLISFTYKRYIDSNKCCFIPGKVLDEIFRVIRYANSVQTIDYLEAFDMLDEIRDLSSMAREHFKENIAHGLDKKQEETTHFTPVRSSAPPSQLYKLPSLMDNLSKKYNHVMSELASLKMKKKELGKVEKRIADLEQFAANCKKKLGETEKTIAEQRATIYRQDMKLFDQELEIEKLKKLVEEMQEGGNAETVCKNSTTGSRRGRNGVRETAIVTRASKRKLRQNLSDQTSTRGRRKKSRRS